MLDHKSRRRSAFSHGSMVTSEHWLPVSAKGKTGDFQHL